MIPTTFLAKFSKNDDFLKDVCTSLKKANRNNGMNYLNLEGESAIIGGVGFKNLEMPNPEMKKLRKGKNEHFIKIGDSEIRYYDYGEMGI